MENATPRFERVHNGSLREGTATGEDRHDTNRVSCWLNTFSENLSKFCGCKMSLATVILRI